MEASTLGPINDVHPGRCLEQESNPQRVILVIGLTFQIRDMLFSTDTNQTEDGHVDQVRVLMSSL
jgi:hypothetical protein